MVSMEVVMGTIGAVGALSAALFGGGLFRQALRHNAETAVQRFRQEQTDVKVKENDASIQELKQDMALVKKDIDGFSSHIRKLDFIPEILAKLAGIETSIQYMKEQIKDLRSDRNDHDKHNS